MLQQILDQITPLFPKHADFRTHASSPNEIGVSWKLLDDPARPSKRSKTIRIQISDEFSEDYRDGNDRIKQSMMAHVPVFVGAMLQDFDPSHNSPVSEPPPEVTWVILS